MTAMTVVAGVNFHLRYRITNPLNINSSTKASTEAMGSEINSRTMRLLVSFEKASACIQQSPFQS
jgi:hypothetical protein